MYFDRNANEFARRVVFASISERADEAARGCVGAALRVHKRLGPGLLESVYETCLAHELKKAGLRAERQLLLPLIYDSVEFEAAYRIDLLVDESLIVEIKSVDALAPIHEAQLLTYLKLSGLRLGLLINFNVPLLKHGIRRFAL